MSDFCVDTGFLLGIYVESDQYHARASRYFEEYFRAGRNRLIVPWPILYEAVSTRMVKNRPAMIRMENAWKRLSRQDRLEMLSDLSSRRGHG